MIYANKLKNKIEIISSNIFMINVIFKNNNINIQINSIIYIIKISIFKNLILSMKKYYPNIYQKVNNLKLILFKIIIIIL